MNGLLIITLVAAASADPQLMLNNFGYHGLPITPYANWGLHAASPLTYTSWGMPATYTAILPKVEKKPMEKIIADDTMKMDTPDYAMKGEYIAESAGVIHKAKRSADPIMPFAYNGLPLTYSSALPLAYKTIMPTTYKTVMPATLKTPAMPIAYNAMPYAYPGLLPLMPKMVADDTLKAGTPEYAMKGRYIAESAGIVHKAKRDTTEKEEDKKIILSAPMPMIYNNWGLPAATAYNGLPLAYNYNTIPAVKTLPLTTYNYNAMPLVAQRPLFF